jgi:thioredoxin-related protein
MKEFTLTSIKILMRKVSAVLLSLLLASFYCHAQNRKPSAEEVLNSVYAQAARENKKVLLLFGASWCGWCHKMDTSLQDKDVKPLIDKSYVTAHLTIYEPKEKSDLENPGALQFLTKHGGADKGIPYWLVLDKEGNILADSQYKPNENSGCPASEEEVEYFINVLRKTSSLNEAQLNIIEKRFRMNEQPAAHLSN